nr:immunoglobulin light chain junction region [Macaca mulatta]MOV99854.1 immunoglobulin light chain junction region [Macaca mulatta]
EYYCSAWDSSLSTRIF